MFPSRNNTCDEALAHCWNLFQYIGQHGVVKRFEDNGDCVIDYDGAEWRFNAEAVRKVNVPEDKNLSNTATCLKSALSHVLEIEKSRISRKR